MSAGRPAPDAIDVAVREWMRRTAPSSAPSHLAAAVRHVAGSTPQERHRPGRWLLTAAAAGAALVVGIAVSLPSTPEPGRTPGSDPAGSPSASTSREPAAGPPSAAASATPARSDAPLVEGWQRATVELPGSNSSRMLAIARGPNGFVAVGGGGSIEGLGGALAWYSTGGDRWELTLDRHAERDGSGLRDVVATADGFVAVGDNPTGPAVWRSTDGRSWSAVDDASVPAGPTHDALIALAAHDGGLLAIGFATEDDEQVATAWSSVDGIAWTRLAVPSSYAAARPSGITVNEDGRGIIAGMSGSGSGDPVAWPVVGGRIGDPIVLARDEEETQVGPAVTTPDGFVILGGRWDPAEAAYRLLAWTSEDGVAWEIEETEAIGLAAGAAYVDGLGLVLVGQTYRLETSEVAMWQRSESGGWTTRLIEDSNGSGAGLATDPSGRLIVIGSDDPDGAATVWLEP